MSSQTLSPTSAGIFTDSATPGVYLYKKNADGSVNQIAVTSILSAQEMAQANQQAGGAIGAVVLAQQKLKQQYGLDVAALPAVNKADLEQSLIKAGQVGPNGVAKMDVIPVTSFLGQPAAQTGETPVAPFDPSMVNGNSALQAPGTQTSPYYQNPNAAMQTPGTMAAPVASQNTPGQAQTLQSSPALPTPTQTAHDAHLDQLLGTSGLSADQQAAIRAVYNAVATNDQANADKLVAGITAGMQYSDPYFKAQASLVLDSLHRGLSAQEGDLSYKESQLTNSLKNLTDNLGASKDYLTFQQAQELNDLKSHYQTNLADTQDQLASKGLTSSSIRSRSEGILSTNYNGLVSSSNRQLGYQTGNLDRQLAAAQQTNALDLAHYQDLSKQATTDLTRKAEETLGSAGLKNAGYTDTLGSIGGTLPRQQAQDALSFGSNFVF